MHWLLSVPSDFSLREVIRRSRWRLIPPLHAKTTGDHLYRVEDLDGTPVLLDIYQAPAGLVVQAESHLSAPQVEEASERVWRLLRLDENLQPFVRMALYTDGLRSVRRSGARLLRGTTLYEDVLTAALATWDPLGRPHFRSVASLVDRFGLPLARNPTLHSFPTAGRLLERADPLTDLLGTQTAALVGAVAAAFPVTSGHPLPSRDKRSTLTELEATLLTSFPLSPPALSLLMLDLGRYDYIPTDGAAVRRYRYAYGGRVGTVRDTLVAFFERFHPWGGLAFWLWDWSRAPEPAAN